jgi:light-regulated signal transduction histidine kinase (bacteriophytochrome)
LIEAFNEMLGQIQERDTALQAARDELELRVVRRTAQLESVNRELESFTYSVAHDLRAPLRHIQGFADALTEDCADRLDPAARGYLNRIVESTRRMDHLINDLLGLAHVGRQELRFQAVGLERISAGRSPGPGAGNQESEHRVADWRPAGRGLRSGIDQAGF